MKSTKYTVSVDPETWQNIDEYADAAGLKTANTLLAAAAVELAKAKKKNLNVWHVLGRIAADDDASEQPRRVRPTPVAIEAR